VKRKRILLVDDEIDIIDILKFHLEKEGYDIITALNGKEAVERAEKFVPDLIVLDLMMPELDGISACRKIKADPITKHIPVIMLTAKSEETDIILGLEFGADDYITKPFSVRVVVAKVRALLRRTATTEQVDEEVVSIGPLFMNKANRTAKLDEIPKILTYSEFEVLWLLSKHPGRVYSRTQIVNAIKGEDYPVTERSIDVQIVGIRKKMGDFARYIETVRGVGYRFAHDIK
jgi:two-component system phosphate regulon response regulator PhoB